MEVIKGIRHTRTFPPGTALVLEGGGTRGFYSAGVFEAFMERGVIFPYIIGVSAGAANALTYIAGQPGRNRLLIEKFVGDPRYVGRRNLIRHRSLFGYDFIFNEIPGKRLFWDKEVFNATDVRFLTGATDCETGQVVWFEKKDISDGFDVTRASCSIPVISKMVAYGGYKLLDGGISEPIPIEKSIADGNTFHVVILTRNLGYRKTPFKHKGVLKLFYSKYPKLVGMILARHEIYNHQLALCEKLEKEGKALIIRPLKPLEVKGMAADIPKLLILYDEGVEEGRAALSKLEQVLPSLPLKLTHTLR